MTETNAIHTEVREAPQNRRELKNHFIKPRYSLTVSYWLIGAGLAFLAGTALVMQWQLSALDGLMNTSPGAIVDQQALTVEALEQVVFTALAGFAGFVLFVAVFSLVLNHRIAGPAYAMMAILDEFIRGNFNYRRQLRNKDELKPLHRRLMELGAQLADQDREQQPT